MRFQRIRSRTRPIPSSLFSPITITTTTSSPHPTSHSIFLSSCCFLLIMAACGSLRHLFESPLPENPSLIESLSTWSPMKSMKPLDESSFIDVFGELHFKESQEPLTANSLSPTTICPPLPLDSLLDPTSNQCQSSLKSDVCVTSLEDSFKNGSGTRRSNDGFVPKNFESLQLCTKGLGFEGSDDGEESGITNGSSRDRRIYRSEMACVAKRSPGKSNGYLKNCSQFRSERGGGFPPPISCIGSSGKPWVRFRSYKQDGRFVLREIRIPTQEFYLHASREDGRLKLYFVLADRDIKGGKQGRRREQQQQDAESRGEERN